MLGRTCIRCTIRGRSEILRNSRNQVARSWVRKHSSTSSSSANVAVPTSSQSTMLLAPFVQELDRAAPSFDLHGDQIQILRTPSEFYETLKVRWETARPDPD